MRRFSAVLLALVLVACQDITDPSRVPIDSQTPQPLASMSSQGAAERVVPGRVLAKFQAGVAAEDVAGPLGLTVEGRGFQSAFVMLRGAAGNERALAAALARDSRVVYAEPDYLREPTFDPALWGFHNDGSMSIRYTNGPNRGRIVTGFLPVPGADENAGGVGTAQGGTYGASGSPVVVGSIDTGLDFGHLAFNGRWIKGHDWYSNDNDPQDENGHGTHTSGTMVGTGVGVSDVSGAGALVKVYVQRVCGQMGCPTSAIVNAIRAAATQGVVAMNLSLGGSSESQSEKDAILFAVDTANALVIASAGNGGTGTVSCPACDPKAIAVGATNWQDGLTYYTNWGTGLDIVAPGGQMYSNTTPESGIYSTYLGGGYRYLQGTSMSAPQVTGTAGVAAAHTGARGSALRARLLGTARDLGSGGYDTSFGCGVLNTYAAVTGAQPGAGACEDPTVSGSGGGSDPAPSTPTAAFGYSCGGNSTCSFSASTSSSITQYDWDFGDDTSAPDGGPSPTHTYNGNGNFDVMLTVHFDGGTDSVTHTVSCSTKGGRVRCK